MSTIPTFLLLQFSFGLSIDLSDFSDFSATFSCFSDLISGFMSAFSFDSFSLLELPLFLSFSRSRRSLSRLKNEKVRRNPLVCNLKANILRLLTSMTLFSMSHVHSWQQSDWPYREYRTTTNNIPSIFSEKIKNQFL